MKRRRRKGNKRKREMKGNGISLMDDGKDEWLKRRGKDKGKREKEYNVARRF